MELLKGSDVPSRVLLVTAFSAFILEVIVMSFIAFLPSMPLFLEAIVDEAIRATVIFFALHIVMVRALTTQGSSIGFTKRKRSAGKAEIRTDKRIKPWGGSLRYQTKPGKGIHATLIAP